MRRVTQREGRLLVKVLGPIDVDGGEPIALGGPSQRRVLAYLALHAGDAVSLDRLVDITWEPDRLPRRAEHNMQSYIHRLRSALGEFGERIETTGTSYRLHLEPGEFDLWTFDESVALARRALESGDATGALEAADRADVLWRGAPFGEFADDSWASAEVGRLTEAVASLAEARCAALLSLRRPDAAVAVIEPVIAEHPLRERPRALLMRALYESGRQAEALRAFQHFRGDLADEVGLEPSSDLVDLDRQIASGTIEQSFDRPDVSGAYEIEELIGQGAFARVYRARQRALDRYVAVKMIRAELANQPVFIQRFEAEAQMVARIEHPNVVSLYDYWREPDRAFLVMRWMTGGSLEQRLDRRPLTLDETVQLVNQIAAGLDAAHRHGIVHRDVKPENILFDDDGHAVISDFGIALETADFDRPESALSEGSPIYAAPEQLRREPAAREADVFALAVVAFVALSGSPPFAETTNAAEHLRRQLEEPIPVQPKHPGATCGRRGPCPRHGQVAGRTLLLRARFRRRVHRRSNRRASAGNTDPAGRKPLQRPPSVRGERRFRLLRSGPPHPNAPRPPRGRRTCARPGRPFRFRQVIGRASRSPAGAPPAAAPGLHHDDGPWP